IGAACAALGISPAVQIITEAVLIAAAALAMAAGIPGGSRAPAGEPHQDRAAKVRQWLRGWLDWRLLLIGVVMLGVELGEGSAGNWLTLAVRNGHGQTAAVAALFAAAFAASEAITRIFGGPIVDRLGRVRTIRVTTALGIVGMVLFILAGNPWIVLVGVLLWAVGVSMGFPLGMSAAAESGPDPAARVSVVGASLGRRLRAEAIIPAFSFSREAARPKPFAARAGVLVPHLLRPRPGLSEADPAARLGIRTPRMMKKGDSASESSASGGAT